MMKISNTCIIVLSIVLLFCVFTNCMREDFGSGAGAQIQLMTSRPYYGWYDYMTNWRNYNSRRYPMRYTVGRGGWRPYLYNRMFW